LSTGGNTDLLAPAREGRVSLVAHEHMTSPHHVKEAVIPTHYHASPFGCRGGEEEHERQGNLCTSQPNLPRLVPRLDSREPITLARLPCFNIQPTKRGGRQDEAQWLFFRFFNI